MNVTHYENAIGLLESGNCLVGDLSFDMSDWATCLHGSARILAGEQAGPFDFNAIEGPLNQKIHIASLVMRTNWSDTRIVTEWRKRESAGWTLVGADLEDAHLGGANLANAPLKGANLANANLTGANLKNTILWGADLRGADLEDTELWGAILSEAILRGANLTGADLRGAHLRGADLEEADLWGAILSEADLQGANLTGADLRGAHLRGATYDDGTVFPSGFDPASAGMVLV